MIDAIMAPLPPDEIAAKTREWLDGLHSTVDAPHVARVGRSALRKLLERIADRSLWLGEEAGDGRQWADALGRCGRGFVQQCTELVEASQGIPQTQSSKIISAAVRLSEAFSRTGPLLQAFETELFAVAEKVSRLEELYGLVIKRADELAGDKTVLSARIDEMRQAEQGLREEARDAKRLFKQSEQRARAAERRAAEARRELYEARRSLRPGASHTSASNASPRKESFEDSAASTEATSSLGDSAAQATSRSNSSVRHFAGTQADPALHAEELKRHNKIPRGASPTWRSVDDGQAEPVKLFEDRAEPLQAETGPVSAMSYGVGASVSKGASPSKRVQGDHLLDLTYHQPVAIGSAARALSGSPLRASRNMDQVAVVGIGHCGLGSSSSAGSHQPRPAAWTSRRSDRWPWPPMRDSRRSASVGVLAPSPGAGLEFPVAPSWVR